MHNTTKEQQLYRESDLNAVLFCFSCVLLSFPIIVTKQLFS